MYTYLERLLVVGRGSLVWGPAYVFFKLLLRSRAILQFGFVVFVCWCVVVCLGLCWVCVMCVWLY